MPRPILKQQTRTQTETNLQTRPAQQKQQQMTQMKLDRYLRKPRSKEYLDAISRLDAGGHVHNQYKVNAIIQALQNEFPELELAGVLIGVISQCYLGAPYEVHMLDYAGCIIQHFKQGEPMPAAMERFRSAACMGGYEAIEVYTDCARAIRPGGAVSVLKY